MLQVSQDNLKSPLVFKHVYMFKKTYSLCLFHLLSSRFILFFPLQL